MNTISTTAVHVGTVLKNTPPRHDIEPKAGFNLHATTLFQKMISKPVLEKGVRIDAEYFYKGLIFLEYFCNVMQGGDLTVCDNLVVLSKKVREIEKEEGKNNKASYFSLDLVVQEAGLCAQDNGSPAQYFDKKYRDGVEARYKTAPIALSRSADPFYQAMGVLVTDFVSKEAQDALMRATSSMDLASVVFVDSVAQVVNSDKRQLFAALKKDYVCASVLAFQKLVKYVDRDDVTAAIKKEVQAKLA